MRHFVGTERRGDDLLKLEVKMAWADIGKTEKEYVNDVLDSGWISRHKYIPRFEEEVAELHGAKYGIAVSSGTDALRISLAVLKEMNGWREEEEVIVPALTFVATVNAILQNNLSPVFADVDLDTGNIQSLDAGDAVAVVPVHLFGLPAPVNPDTHLKIVEDSCETFGVHRLRGDMACFSFYVSHHISTGVGGMILTNSPEYEKLARSFMNHGRIDDGTHFEFGRSGFSSRMTELQAALGCAALEKWPEELEKRRMLAKVYQEYFPTKTEHRNHSWMFFPQLLQDKGARGELMAHLSQNGIESREAMPLVNQPVFRDLYERGSCPNAENWTETGILFPLHPQMSESDARHVAETTKEFLSKRLSPA